MAAAHESKRTTNHDEIRRWAEQRGGEPASRFFKFVQRH